MIAYDLNKYVYLNSKIINNQTNRFYSINSSSYFEIYTLEDEISIFEMIANIDTGDFIEIYWINKSNEIYTREKSIKIKILDGITNRYMFEIPDKNVYKIKIHLTNIVVTNMYIESLKTYSNIEDFIESNITREFVLDNDIRRKLYKSMLQIIDKVPIITINHNSSDFMEKLLNSIYEKVKYKNIEIIIIDNASVDDSMSVIKSYCDKLNIKIIENKKNETFSKSRR